MSDKVDISGTIKVEDKASPTIRRIQQNIAKITDNARKMGTSFARVANMGMLGGIAQNARNAAGALGRVGVGILKIGGSLAAVAGIAGFGGLAHEMTQYINTTDALAKTSARIGVTVEQLQQLRHAAGLSGVEVATLETSLGQLNRRMGEAAAGKNKDLAELMKRLGISLKDAQGNIRGAAEVLPQLANAFEKNTNVAVRARMANTAFGKSGEDMILLLKEGGPALKAMMDEMVKLGTITTEQAKAAEAANDAQARMNTAIRGVSNAIMGSLVPALTPLIEQFTEWVATNRDWIATGVTKFITDFGKALAGIPWDQVIAGIQQMGSVMKTAFDLIGGFNAILPAFATIMGGIVLKSISGVVIALSSLTVALISNPIGAAIAAIAVAAYLIYKYWEPISAFFVALWAQVEAAFNVAAGWFSSFAEFFLPDNIEAAWNGVAAWFTGMWDGVKAGFDAALTWLAGFAGQFIPGGLLDVWQGLSAGFAAGWAGIKAVFDRALAWHDSFVGQFVPGGLLGAWQAISGAFTAIWNGPREAFDAALAWHDSFVGQFIPGGLLGAWEAISGALSAIWNSPREAFAAALVWHESFMARFLPEPLMAAWRQVAGFFAGLWATVESVFQHAWSVIGPIIDQLMAAIRPLIGAVESVGNAAAKVGGGVANLAGKVGEGLGGAAGWLGRQVGIGGGAAPSGVAASPTQAVSPVAAAAAAAPAPVARVDGEVKSTVKIELPPGLKATATTEDRGRVTSSVDVGTSMQPA